MTDTNQTRTVMDTIDSLSSFTRSVYHWFLCAGWDDLDASNDFSDVTAQDAAKALGREVLRVKAAISQLVQVHLVVVDDSFVYNQYGPHDSDRRQHHELLSYRDELVAVAVQDIVGEPDLDLEGPEDQLSPEDEEAILTDEPYRGPCTKLIKVTKAQRAALQTVARYQAGIGSSTPCTRLHPRTLQALEQKDLVERNSDGYSCKLTHEGRRIVDAANGTEQEPAALDHGVADETTAVNTAALDALMAAKAAAYTAAHRAANTVREAQWARQDADDALAKIEQAIALIKQ